MVPQPHRGQPEGELHGAGGHQRLHFLRNGQVAAGRKLLVFQKIIHPPSEAPPFGRVQFAVVSKRFFEELTPAFPARKKAVPPPSQSLPQLPARPDPQHNQDEQDNGGYQGYGELQGNEGFGIGY
jgi:hypothetical protein